MKEVRLKMYQFSILILILLLSCSNRPQNFEDLLQKISDTDQEKRNQVISEYILYQQKFPEINDTSAYFLFKSQNGGDAYLVGDMSGWKPDSIKLKAIEGSDYYYIRQNFPEDARMEYKFIENNQAYFDPFNPQKDGGPLGMNSVLFMPQFKFPQDILAQRENATSQIDTIELKSRILNNTRKILVYKPETNSEINTLILFHDGPEYIQFANARIILDNLIAEGKVPPVYGVFIPPVERMKEYWLNEDYLKMIFRELLPKLRNGLHLDQSAKVGMGGASLGGVTSLFALTRFGDQLSFVFSQSGAVQISDKSIVDELQKTDNIDAKVCLQYGTFEKTELIHREIETILEHKNVYFEMKKINEGHNWGNWRGHLPEALIFCLNNGEKRP